MGLTCQITTAENGFCWVHEATSQVLTTDPVANPRRWSVCISVPDNCTHSRTVHPSCSASSTSGQLVLVTKEHGVAIARGVEGQPRRVHSTEAAGNGRSRCVQHSVMPVAESDGALHGPRSQAHAVYGVHVIETMVGDAPATAHLCTPHATSTADVLAVCWQVEELLQLDASNEEYQELAKSLAEVIELTEDLLREAAGGAAAPAQPGADIIYRCVTMGRIVGR